MAHVAAHTMPAADQMLDELSDVLYAAFCSPQVIALARTAASTITLTENGERLFEIFKSWEVSVAAK
ncbi:hypothetical protein OPV22_010772 [Ensete ventricosum]|uniref:Uncharacterized protein n=1 Tax=Ensete ventricosum TaxID=4639 RepID=A0AAV8RE54_ENSVE|nr:hypothetical protein OPV22_010772 [Ensete ventricosum]